VPAIDKGQSTQLLSDFRINIFNALYFYFYYQSIKVPLHFMYFLMVFYYSINCKQFYLKFVVNFAHTVLSLKVRSVFNNNKFKVT